jgi:hypothetical protein
MMAEVDLREVERLMIDSSVTVDATSSGVLNGLLVYFELDIGPTTRLSTHPAQADRDCSWFSMVWVLDPLAIKVNDQLNVTYQYRAKGASQKVAVARA